MLKRLYKRFLLWALAPVIAEIRIGSHQVLVDEEAISKSLRGASSDFDALVDKTRARLAVNGF